MRNSLLIPNRYRVFGWILFVVFGGFFIVSNIFELDFPKIFDVNYSVITDWSNNNISDEILLTLVLAGLLMIAFSREKNEDEYISFVRLKSWQWAVVISYAVLFLGTWLIYGGAYLTFMVYNMFTVLFVFIIKFNYSLYRIKKEGIEDEK